MIVDLVSTSQMEIVMLVMIDHLILIMKTQEAVIGLVTRVMWKETVIVK